MPELQTSDTFFISALLKEHPQFSSEDEKLVRVPTKLIMGIARAAVAAGVDMGVKMTTEEFNKVLKNIVPNAPVIPSPREKSVADISAELREILGREES